MSKGDAVEEKPLYRLEFYTDDAGRPIVRQWLRGLSFTKKQVLGKAMREVLQHLGVGVCGTEFGKHLGDGLFEFRVRRNADEVFKGSQRLPPENVLTRVFCHAYGDRIVLLVGGYDKGEDPSKKRQNSEIQEARRRLAAWLRRRRS